MIGQRIDRYVIVEQLGEGGMGVVYKARDTLLERLVAIKVLPPDKSSDPERRRRFLQEAKSASALNHPGIVTVHDVLSVDGRDVLVMELVDGETLEELLARGRPAQGHALGLAIGIADALARAHAAGIVHRDLKPSNVMVTSDGVKVLDFGLAKLTGSEFLETESPTVAPGEGELTGERVIIGTAGWMSPEQASAGTVDARSDIFSFGVLLYQMLTGRHPFRGATVLETLEAIRSRDPEPIRGFAPAVLPEIERAVLRCLRKEPQRRWQNLADLRAVLEDLKQDSESGRRVISPEPRSIRRRLLPWLAGAAALVVVAAVAVALLVRREPAPQPLDLSRLTYDAGASVFPAISPDGNFVAFTSDRGGDGGLDIWVRHIKQQEPTRLTDHPADDWMPSYSPDGGRIVFRSGRDGGGIYVVNAVGGGLRKVAGRGRLPRFTPDGTAIVFVEDPDWTPTYLRQMFSVPANGGVPTPFLPGWGVRPAPGSAGPVFSPDGRLVLFFGAPLDDPRRRDWWVAPVEGGEPRSSGAVEALPPIDIVQFPSLWLPGRLLFIAGTTIEGLNLYSAHISDEGVISGPVSPLTTGPGMTWLPAVSRNGRIALARFSWVIHLWEAALDPATGEAIGAPRRVTHDAAPKFSFALSRDGDSLVYSTYTGDVGNRRAEVMLQDRRTGTERALVNLAAATTSLHPRISGDGSLLSWTTPVDRELVTYVAATAEPAGRELCRGCTVADFFADGEHVLVDQGRRLVRMNLADGGGQPVIDLGKNGLIGADLSRDNRWLAVLTGRPDNTVAIIAAPVRESPVGREDWVTVAGGDAWVGSPHWSDDGGALYFLSDRDDFICIWGQQLDQRTKRPVGEPFGVVHAHRSGMSMLPISRSMWTLDVAGARLVFNSSAVTGDIYTALLEPSGRRGD